MILWTRQLANLFKDIYTTVIKFTYTKQMAIKGKWHGCHFKNSHFHTNINMKVNNYETRKMALEAVLQHSKTSKLELFEKMLTHHQPHQEWPNDLPQKCRTQFVNCEPIFSKIFVEVFDLLQRSQSEHSQHELHLDELCPGANLIKSLQACKFVFLNCTNSPFKIPPTHNFLHFKL